MVFLKNNGVLKNLAKFTGKHLTFFNKVSGLRHSCFPVNFAKFLRTPFLWNTLMAASAHTVLVEQKHITPHPSNITLRKV